MLISIQESLCALIGNIWFFHVYFLFLNYNFMPFHNSFAFLLFPVINLFSVSIPKCIIWSQMNEQCWQIEFTQRLETFLYVCLNQKKSMQWTGVNNNNTVYNVSHYSVLDCNNRKHQRVYWWLQHMALWNRDKHNHQSELHIC